MKDCAICGEATTENDIAEMYDPTTNVGSAIVHPDCGLARGWKVA